MLAALVVIGLAVAGLAQGMHVIGRIQSLASRADADSSALRAAQDGMTRLTERQGPFATDGGPAFSGAASGFAFACDGSATCRATIGGSSAPYQIVMSDAAGVKTVANLPAKIAAVRFVYGGSGGEVTSSWPPNASAGRQTLRWVALRGTYKGSPMSIAAAHVWKDQPRDCVFDPISQTCRKPLR